MPVSYNKIAGQSVERLAALSDGVFAVAMTLLLLELHTPGQDVIHSESDWLHAMAAFGPQLAVYLMSFLTLGIFWMGQQTQLNYLQRSDRNLSWLHLAFLFAVTLMPVSTRFLTEFAQYRSALLAYWANILLLGVILYLSWGCVTRAHLIKDEISPEVPSAICRRIVVGQCSTHLGLCYAYSIAIGALRLSSWCRCTSPSRRAWVDVRHELMTVD